jgi:hypothetical protein
VIDMEHSGHLYLRTEQRQRQAETHAQRPTAAHPHHLATSHSTAPWRTMIDAAPARSARAACGRIAAASLSSCWRRGRQDKQAVHTKTSHAQKGVTMTRCFSPPPTQHKHTQTQTQTQTQTHTHTQTQARTYAGRLHAVSNARRVRRLLSNREASAAPFTVEERVRAAHSERFVHTTTHDQKQHGAHHRPHQHERHGVNVQHTAPKTDDGLRSMARDTAAWRAALPAYPTLRAVELPAVRVLPKLADLRHASSTPLTAHTTPRAPGGNTYAAVVVSKLAACREQRDVASARDAVNAEVGTARRPSPQASHLLLTR